MLDKTLGYILCCQSPALFLAALALLVAYLAGRKHKVRAFFRLLLCILCAAGGVALYFLGIYKEYFTIRDFFLIRTAGWIGLAIAAFFVLLALVRAFFAAADARREQKAAIREENERLAREAQEAAEATQAEPAPLRPRLPRRSRYPKRRWSLLPIPPSRLRCQKMSSRRAKLTIIQIMVNPSAAQKCGRWVFCRQSKAPGKQMICLPGAPLLSREACTSRPLRCFMVALYDCSFKKIGDFLTRF